jgi:hypothetical protein
MGYLAESHCFDGCGTLPLKVRSRSSNNIVPFDYCRHTRPVRAVFHSVSTRTTLPSARTNTSFAYVRMNDLRRRRQGSVELRASFQVFRCIVLEEILNVRTTSQIPRKTNQASERDATTHLSSVR